ncbi:MAG: hypothetical protein A3H91_16700 [Gammaproteobacteria bacterium RIFCSPLOWO2_02_FULL_61_13]|nr:MAG: hypothetical protein A3H91_16700 [Gammaproteobacteria bacterium RIFCSPLOWO2_02_FULL_61_13]
MRLPGMPALLLLCIPLAAPAGTLEAVRERGFLRCGIVESSPGFSVINDQGERAGFDIDHCKTLAAAIFGEFKIEYVPVTPHTAFTLLQSGGVDVFPDGATWSFTRDISVGLDYAGVYLFAGQTFLVRKDSGIRRVADMDGATICIAQGTTLEQNMADYFGARGMHYQALTFADIDKGLQAYHADRCDAFTNEGASTAGRIANWPDRDDHMIMEEVISKEPFGPMVRQDDPRWRDLVLWSFNAVIAAEELGVNQANVEEQRRTSQVAEVQRMLGVNGAFGEKLGLSKDWAYNIIRLVGNYEDQWRRSFTPLGLKRGLNATWQNGGLHSALPFR